VTSGKDVYAAVQISKAASTYTLLMLPLTAVLSSRRCIVQATDLQLAACR
jgi:hypothetical protein